ncbi:hypothetical protein Nepgr_004199 [Nepenthes gracilis]|uniref:Uncharacterized protein n=1 Tax=Nepenthes gracilis TaxID=150966 RepID=A0AAD3S0W9_NEPGR|nr:hypothetical protein Nepgr_004199 [Nepenthes gracilis]
MNAIGFLRKTPTILYCAAERQNYRECEKSKTHNQKLCSAMARPISRAIPSTIHLFSTELNSTIHTKLRLLINFKSRGKYR